ncbi:unnamed protein product [Gongylonema pulchrum]|uniref:Transmembrane protein n=1 Tax=Gongylonema pulchrum TaxID=637853 RepID=A0A183DPL8_9BILA|nr:unnamed protein product [Gongylonema pulchrum]
MVGDKCSDAALEAGIEGRMKEWNKDTSQEFEAGTGDSSKEEKTCVASQNHAKASNGEAAQSANTCVSLWSEIPIHLLGVAFVLISSMSPFALSCLRPYNRLLKLTLPVNVEICGTAQNPWEAKALGVSYVVA